MRRPRNLPFEPGGPSIRFGPRKYIASRTSAQHAMMTVIVRNSMVTAACLPQQPRPILHVAATTRGYQMLRSGLIGDDNVSRIKHGDAPVGAPTGLRQLYRRSRWAAP